MYTGRHQCADSCVFIFFPLLLLPETDISIYSLVLFACDVNSLCYGAHCIEALLVKIVWKTPRMTLCC